MRAYNNTEKRGQAKARRTDAQRRLVNGKRDNNACCPVTYYLFTAVRLCV